MRVRFVIDSLAACGRLDFEQGVGNVTLLWRDFLNHLMPSSLGSGDLPFDGFLLGSLTGAMEPGYIVYFLGWSFFAGCCLRPGVGVGALTFADGLCSAVSGWALT